MSFKSNTSIAGVIGLALTLTGCSSMTASLTRELATAQKTNVYNAEVLSIKSPYRIKSTTVLYGDDNAGQTAPTDALQTISQGHYRNWHWVVKAPRAVSVSWRIWKAHGHQRFEDSSHNDTVSPVLGWESGMQRMYSVAQYLLGEEPLPLQAEIELVPKGESRRLIVTLSSPNQVPLRVAYWYPTTTADTKDAAKARWEFMTRALAVVGANLSHVQLAAGSAAAPVAQHARRIKDTANGFCWNYAFRSAFTAGAADLQIPTVSEVTDFQIKLIANAQESYPLDQQLTQLYGGLLMYQTALDFLKQKGIPQPEDGSDLRGINAVLGFCRAFTHYDGDIRSEPLPLQTVEISEFFTPITPDTVEADS